MSGKVLEYKKQLRLQIVQEEELLHNSQVARTSQRSDVSWTKWASARWFQVYGFEHRQKITRRNWDAIPMPDWGIAHVNVLRVDQPDLLTSTDQHSHLIGDIGFQGIMNNFDPTGADYVEFPGVDPVINNDMEISGVDGVEGLEVPAVGKTAIRSKW